MLVLALNVAPSAGDVPWMLVVPVIVVCPVLAARAPPVIEREELNVSTPTPVVDEKVPPEIATDDMFMLAAESAIELVVPLSVGGSFTPVMLMVLVTGLLGALAENGRVVMLSSGSHLKAPAQGIQFDNLSGEKSYDPLVNYGQSKFANILFAKELARRFAGTARTANAIPAKLAFKEMRMP